MSKIDSGTDWTFKQIDQCYSNQQQIVSDLFQLDYYPNQIEMISSEQMLDAYSATGLPIYYDHWSFGKKFVMEQEMYRRGHMGLAYEIVINSNPCISYLMEENTMCMQALVIAHAAFGHNSFFKNNQAFRQWTDAEAIIDYLVFAKNYIRECERKYGIRQVEAVLDAAHALKYNGIDRYKRPARVSQKKLDERQRERDQYDQQHFNDIWRTIPNNSDVVRDQTEGFPSEPQENILYFIEKHAPNLETWKREILRIVRKISQYFYPQMLTQKMNEGWATFVHYHIIHEMHNRGLVTDGFMLEFTKSHTNVIKQRNMTTNINPYALGFAIYQDIKRVAINPTKEDEKWFKSDWVGCGDWVSTVKFAMENFKDESFILQYLSPKVMRDFKMMYVLDDDNNPDMIVSAIQDDEGYRIIRERLSDDCNVNNKLPNIQIHNVNVWGDRAITLYHQSHDRHELDADQATKTLHHLRYLWGYDVYLHAVDQDGDVFDTMEAVGKLKPKRRS